MAWLPRGTTRPGMLRARPANEDSARALPPVSGPGRDFRALVRPLGATVLAPVSGRVAPQGRSEARARYLGAQVRPRRRGRGRGRGRGGRGDAGGRRGAAGPARAVAVACPWPTCPALLAQPAAARAASPGLRRAGGRAGSRRGPRRRPRTCLASSRFLAARSGPGPGRPDGRTRGSNPPPPPARRQVPRAQVPPGPRRACRGGLTAERAGPSRHPLCHAVHGPSALCPSTRRDLSLRRRSLAEAGGSASNGARARRQRRSPSPDAS